jgi:hypothetical protein
MLLLQAFPTALPHAHADIHQPLTQILNIQTGTQADAILRETRLKRGKRGNSQCAPKEGMTATTSSPSRGLAWINRVASVNSARPIRLAVHTNAHPRSGANPAPRAQTALHPAVLKLAYLLADG